jgi:undecaprenyl-diphosphatase
MQLLQAALLGVVQGLTEFLPVSSSAHLILVREVLGWRLLDDPHWNMIFDVSAHAGTFAALVAYFWGDIRRLVSAFFVSLRSGLGDVPDRRLAWILLVATVPGGLAGWLGQDAIESFFRQAPMLVATLLVIFGLILWAADRLGRRAREFGEVGWLDGMLIGCAQALALAPGVSRSGITMTVGLARGMTREAAARFSFLLCTPIVGAAAVFGLKDVAGSLSALPQGSLPTLAVGFVCAAGSGYLCIHYFLRYLERRALEPFIVYRVAVGIVLLVWFVSGSGRPTAPPLGRRWRPLRGDLGGERHVLVVAGDRAAQAWTARADGAGGESRPGGEDATGRAWAYPVTTLSAAGALESRVPTASAAVRARNAIQLTMLSSFAAFSTSSLWGMIGRPKTVSSMCH